MQDGMLRHFRAGRHARSLCEGRGLSVITNRRLPATPFAWCSGRSTQFRLATWEEGELTHTVKILK